MRVQLIFILLIILGTVKLTAQTILTKEEIINSWESPKLDTTDLRHFSFDERLNAKINSLVDSLTQNGIDTIIIYTIAYPGSFITNSCYDYIHPIDAYIIWPKKGKINYTSMKGKCRFNIVTHDSSAIFNYYNDNETEILSEKIMPVILNAQRTKDSMISYSMTMIDHEPNYRLQLRVGKTLQILDFTDSYIENKESLFHDHNQKLKSIQLWKRIENEISNTP